MKNFPRYVLPIGTLPFAAALLVSAVFAGSSAAGETPKSSAATALKGETSETLKSVPAKRGRLISFVVLLKEPRKLDESSLGDMVSKAVGIARDPDTVDKGFLVAKPPYYKVELKSGVYVINNIATPYFENADKLAKEIEDPQLRAAVAEHHAWIAVDWAGKEEPVDVRAAYSDMGKIAAALARPDALAIYSPEEGQLSVFNDSVATAMTGEDPLQIFDGDSDDTVSISDNDAQLQAAQAKARKAWPEFTKAYQAKTGKNFAVSGRIVEGDNSEYMWLTVTSIDAHTVHGTLDSAPVALTTLKMGQDLHVNVSEVDDWLYIGKDNVPVGGFTRDALMHGRDSASNDAR
jgi:uncharacterized protein YegJ (DUF2314 family)